jgi:hypothetical protein
MLDAQRNFQLARHRPGANKGGRQKPQFLLDTQLSSRIQRNSRLLCYLIFSTRHLNATLEKRNLVEKFNTFVKQSFTHVSGLDLTNVVRKEGVEPPRPHGHRILSPARLPIPPLPHRWINRVPEQQYTTVSSPFFPTRFPRPCIKDCLKKFAESLRVQPVANFLRFRRQKCACPPHSLLLVCAAWANTSFLRRA